MKSPIIIIGNPRSGTTLLRLMLTCHRNIVIPPECGFAVWWYKKYNDWDTNSINSRLNDYLDDLFQSKKIELWNLNRVELEKYILSKQINNYSELVSSIYEYFAENQKKGFHRWGDKNNFHLNYIDTIYSLFPGAQFIHIIRDGRDVACSYKDMSKLNAESKYAPKLPVDINTIAKEWVDNIQLIRTSFASLGWNNIKEIRYEDITTDPEGILKGVCSFLNEEYDPSMLAFHSHNERMKLEPIEFLAWKNKTLMEVTTSQISRYKAELTSNEIEMFNEIAGDLLAIYGYQ